MNKRIIALMIAAAIPLSLNACAWRFRTDNDKDKSSVSEKETKPSSENDDTSLGNVLLSGEPAPDLDEVREHIEQLLDDIKIPDNRDKITEDIDLIIYDLDACKEAQTLITFEYYSDWDNESLGEKYDESYEKLFIAGQLAVYAFCHGYAEDEYKDIFEPYIVEDAVESYTDPALSIKRLEGYAKVDYEVMDERLDEYYDIIADEDLSDDEINIRCAELYLDLLGEYDTETFYEQFNRDYTPEEILELSRSVKDELLPASDKLLEAIYDCDGIDEILDDPKEFEDPFEVIREYSPKLSDEIENAANKINNEQLYRITTDEESYTGSFTDTLPVSKSAMIYVHDNKDYTSLITAVHEFGHFYASSYDDTPYFLGETNLDIAEVQSQGFQFIFTRFFDDIFGDTSEAMQAVMVYDMLDSVITGFLVGEFEYTVLKNRDSFTPEDVVECFHDIMDEYIPDYEFYYISHLFEQPGYYISYGVSALAAFEIWQDSIYDENEALDKYEKFARISCDDADNQFRAALEACGFNDVIDKKYITVLAEEISDFADQL